MKAANPVVEDIRRAGVDAFNPEACLRPHL